MEARLHAEVRVWQMCDVFSAAECEQLVLAVEAAASRRGWDRLRHSRFHTTDLPLACVPASELWPLVPCAVLWPVPEAELLASIDPVRRFLGAFEGDTCFDP